MRKVNVLIAVDQGKIRMEIVRELTRCDDVQVVGVAKDGTEALDKRIARLELKAKQEFGGE